ncbi:unnamed protein product [Jaminaea pallidilutea]
MLPNGQFLCPGFIDTHTHACQVPNIGLGQQYELLDWLQQVTFPRERRFADFDYAERTYNSIVQRMIDCGTTTACYYATLHLEATKSLARICTQRGQRAFVGKCQMDRNSPQDYTEKSAAQSLHDTKAFIAYCEKLHEKTRSRSKSVLSAASIASSNTESGSSAFSSSFPSSSGSDGQPSDCSSGSTPSSSIMSPLEETRGNEKLGGDEDDELMRHSVEKLSKTVDEIISTDESTADQDVASTETNLAKTSPSTSPTDALAEAASLSHSNALVHPILTPRFAISCTDSLLTGISAILSRDPTLRIQTHLSESPDEIAFTRELFPFASSYTQLYDHFGLLTDRTVLAHAIHLDEKELQMLKARDCGISHCPTSNMNLRSGATKLGDMLNRGIKVSLGTDASGGFGLGMLSAIREASVVAKVVQFTQRDVQSDCQSQAEVNERDADPAHATEDFTQKPLSPATLLWLATVGGAQVATIDDRTGSLEVGKEFDALHVRMDVEPGYSGGACSGYAYSGNPSAYVEEGESLEALVEKFLFTGDDRNIANVWVRSRLIGGVDFRNACCK